MNSSSLVHRSHDENNHTQKHCINNDSNNIDIEIEWKETRRRVRFDPAMDWKLEVEKAEKGSLRRLAEREIRKRLDQQKHLQRQRDHKWYLSNQLIQQQQPILTKIDRHQEAFVYITFCDLDMLVSHYQSSDTLVLTRVFDSLFEDAGIKTIQQRMISCKLQENRKNNHNDAEENESWLWTSFLALQIEYRRLYDDDARKNTLCNQWQNAFPMVAGLSRNTELALYFIHWLSPVFQFDEKREAKQRQTFFSVMGNQDVAARFEEFLFGGKEQGEIEENYLNDLRMQVHRFFDTAFCQPLSGSMRLKSSRSENTDLGAYVSTICNNDGDLLGENNRSGCEWAFCDENIPQDHLLTSDRHFVPYESLNLQSKNILFVISSMPAFRAYTRSKDNLQLFQSCEERNHIARLLNTSFLGCSIDRSGNSNDNCCTPTSTNAIPCASEENLHETTNKLDFHSDCPLLSSHYEFKFTQELFDLLFKKS